MLRATGARSAAMTLKPNAQPATHVLSRKARMISYGSATMVAPATRVAILADDQSVRTAIGRLLTTSQMEVDLFRRCRGRFHARQRKGPCCPDLDRQMPGRDGIDGMRLRP